MKNSLLFIGFMLVLLLISAEEQLPEPVMTNKDNLSLKYELCFAPERDWTNQDLNHFCKGNK
jgi:hypothetical protein